MQAYIVSLKKDSQYLDETNAVVFYQKKMDLEDGELEVDDEETPYLSSTG